MAERTPLGSVREISWKDEDAKTRLHALSILTAGATIIDTDRDTDGRERERLEQFIDAGCSDEYAYCDENGPVVTADRAWYHIVTCEGARECYRPTDYYA